MGMDNNVLPLLLLVAVKQTIFINLKLHLTPAKAPDHRVLNQTYEKRSKNIIILTYEHIIKLQF